MEIPTVTCIKPVQNTIAFSIHQSYWSKLYNVKYILYPTVFEALYVMVLLPTLFVRTALYQS